MGSVPMAQWQEFLLPDGSCYFLNRILNIVTDFDLRDAESLQAVTKYIHGRHTEIPPPPEWGLWLYNASGPNTAFIPLIAWVNHGARKVVFGSPTSLELGGFICKDIDSKLLGFMHANACADDFAGLDSEHQYWSFMASHPVHALLPPGSITEAIDLLTWFYTSLLPTWLIVCCYSFDLYQVGCFHRPAVIPCSHLVKKNARNLERNFGFLAVSIITVTSGSCLRTYIPSRYVHPDHVTCSYTCRIYGTRSCR